MLWVMLGLLALGAAVAWGIRPMHIPREPDREGIEDPEAVLAYDTVSNLPVFALVRHIVLSELRKSKPGGVLVDIGCGPGYLVADICRRFPDLDSLGVDISPDMLHIAHRDRARDCAVRGQFVLGDVQRLPFPDAALDYVLSSLSLHHWSDARRAFHEIYRVLKPGGRFIVLDLRRDAPRAVYYAFKVGQRVIAPPAIRRTNGAVGSFWASYTTPELRAMLSGMAVDELEVRRGLGWHVAMGRKPHAPAPDNSRLGTHTAMSTPLSANFMIYSE